MSKAPHPETAMQALQAIKEGCDTLIATARAAAPGRVKELQALRLELDVSPLTVAVAMEISGRLKAIGTSILADLNARSTEELPPDVLN